MRNCIGISVGQSCFDISISQDEKFGHFDFNRAGFKKLNKFLKDYDVSIVLVESVGVDLVDLLVNLILAGYDVVIVNPNQIRELASNIGIAEDSYDATSKRIAKIGSIIKDEVLEKKSNSFLEAKDCAVRIRDLIEMKNTETRYSKSATEPIVVASINTSLEMLTNQIYQFRRMLCNLLELDLSTNDIEG